MTATVTRSMEQYKTLGNTCFAEQQFAKAIEFYSKGLRVCKKEDSINLYSNRAVCYIKLDCFQKGLDDTNAVLQQNPRHEKGIFRHVKCLWGLGQYESALTFLNSKLAKFSELFESKDLLDLRHKAEACLHESKTGQYDIVELMRHPQNQPTDVAEYVGPVKIRDVLGKGRGIIAEESIKTGQLIMCCKPFAFYPYDQEELGVKANFALVDRILEKLEVDPQLRKEVFPLNAPLASKFEEPSSFQLPQDDLELAQLHSIIANNSFEFNGSGNLFQHQQPYYWSGLWILPSYINHSCSGANATWCVYGDAFFVRAVRPISKGDEILITYVNITWPYKHRSSVIKDHKFECECTLCQYENEESEEVVEKRERIFDQLDEIYEMEGLMPKETIINCFTELDLLRKDCPHLNFCLANAKIITILQRFLVERTTTQCTTQCRLMFERVHLVTKNTAHAKFVVQICIHILNCLMEDDTSETGTIQAWIKQLKDDLIAAHGSPKALQCVGPDMLDLLKDMLHANDFV